MTGRHFFQLFSKFWIGNTVIYFIFTIYERVYSINSCSQLCPHLLYFLPIPTLHSHLISFFDTPLGLLMQIYTMKIQKKNPFCWTLLAKVVKIRCLDPLSNLCCHLLSMGPFPLHRKIPSIPFSHKDDFHGDSKKIVSEVVLEGLTSKL
jgi:hypothetical protein